MRVRAAVLGAMLAVAGVPAEAQRPQTTRPCPAERAIYTIPESDAQMRLLRPAHAVNGFSDLAMRVDAGGYVFWFSFVSSNGYGRDFISYITDPTAPGAEGDLELRDAQSDNDIGVFSADMTYLAIPQARDPAPQYIYAPGIGVRFWYDAPERTHVPVGMWRLTECVQP